MSSTKHICVIYQEQLNKAGAQRFGAQKHMFGLNLFPNGASESVVWHLRFYFCFVFFFGSPIFYYLLLFYWGRYFDDLCRIGTGIVWEAFQRVTGARRGKMMQLKWESFRVWGTMSMLPWRDGEIYGEEEGVKEIVTVKGVSFWNYKADDIQEVARES